ncbi:MAG: FlgD immunoglobulin-like domain containing protein [Bacteroidota bacterium]
MSVAYRMTFVFVLILAVAVSAFGESLVATNQKSFVPVVQSESGILLWNNTIINTVSSGIVSNDLRGRNPDSSLVQTADDFVVPAGVKWFVDSLWVRGFSTVAGLPDSFAVAVYNDDAGKPGTLVHLEAVIPANGIRFDSLKLKLGAPVSLTTGTYWLSVYAVYNTGTVLSQTRWNWYTGSIPIGLQGHIQDFTGLFGIPPFPWTPLSSLGVTQPSTHFAIYGTSVEPAQVLVMLQDTTLGTATQIGLKRADNDTALARISQQVTNFDVVYRDTLQSAIPSYRSYSTLILIETSFITPSLLKATQRDSIKAFLNAGTPSAQKSLVVFGGDFGYAYSRAASAQADVVLTSDLMKFLYRIDNGNVTAQRKVVGIAVNTGLQDSMAAGAANFYPDGVTVQAGGVALFGYAGRGTVDTVGGVGYDGANYNTAVVFQDPRYMIPSAADAAGGFKRQLSGVLAWIAAAGGVVTDVDENPSAATIPDAYELAQNYPNPFNPTTNIQYALPRAAEVTLKIFNVLGQEVATLVDAVQEAGRFEATWNGRTSNGLTVSSGVYFYQLTVKGSGTTETFSSMKKMVLMK